MKRFAIFAVIVLAAFPLFAQGTHFVGFDNFSFFLDSSVASIVNISQPVSDPPDLQQPGGPEVTHTKFALFNEQPTSENFFFPPGEIRVYRLTDIAGYADVQAQVDQLTALLASRPDLAAATDELPYLPIVAASQVVRGQAKYVELGTLTGISYITAYRQDVSPFVGNSFLYTFQGISTDGGSYVTAVFLLNTGLFPAEIPTDFDYNAFSADYENYLAQTVATLNAALPTDFTPSLATLDSMIQSFAITTGTTVATTTPSVATAVPVPTTVGATPVPTSVVSDPTLGGLAGTWNLVSYGDPAAPTLVIPGTTVTLTFAPGGVSGNGGCNQFGSGTFSYENNSLSIGLLISTLMACVDGGVMEQESAYLAALQGAQTFAINGSQLQITYADGVLTFLKEGAVPPSDGTVDPTLGGLVGTWNLVSYGDPAAPTPVIEGSTANITFAPDGVSGNGSCNQFSSGAFSLQGSTLTIGALVSTKMACEEPRMSQENAYLGALQAAQAFAINGDQLQITYASGVLTFARSI
jgi:heat shock protein HslJ